MTLEEARARSAYLMRSKRVARWMYTPSEYENKGKDKVVEEERPRRSIAGRRMRFNNDDDEESENDVDDEEEPQPTGRKKIPPKRGRGTSTRGRK